MSSTNGEPIEAETGRPNRRSRSARVGGTSDLGTQGENVEHDDDRNDDNMHDECMPNDQTGEDALLQENEGTYNSKIHA